MKRGIAVEGSSFLVTGCAGFVGSHLVDKLLERGASRIVGLDQQAAPANLEHFQSDKRFEYFPGHLSEKELVKKVTAGIDGVFHLAVLPLGPCTENPELAMEVNVVGAFNVFRAAANAGAKKIVYSSASSVYGETLEVMDENHPLNAETFYGVSKLTPEFWLRPLKSKLDFIILRYMNVYGPRQSGGLIPNVIRKISRGEAPVLHGDGSASFDFVHVSDVAACNLLAMESAVTGEAFNVGSGEEFSVREITEIILKASGSDLKPQFDTSVPIPMSRRVGSSKKAEKMLGYRPRVNLEEGIRGLCAYAPL